MEKSSFTDKSKKNRIDEFLLIENLDCLLANSELSATSNIRTAGIKLSLQA